MVVGMLAPNKTLSEWRMVFWIICAINVVSNVIFVIFASGEVQEWNDPNFERRKIKQKSVDDKEMQNLLLADKFMIGSTEKNLSQKT